MGLAPFDTRHIEPSMPDRNAPASALDHSHCRAICEEIGERLRLLLKPTASDIPPRLRALMDRLADLDEAPSIVPSIDETCFADGRSVAAPVTPSSGPARPATSRGSVFAGS